MELIRLADIHFAYPGGRPVLKGVDFALAEGERVGILGPNGAGKSTLFQVAMGLLPPASGEVAFLGEPCRGEGDFRRLRRAVGYVFQDPDDMLFCPTVLEEVASASSHWASPGKRPGTWRAPPWRAWTWPGWPGG